MIALAYGTGHAGVQQATTSPTTQEQGPSMSTEQKQALIIASQALQLAQAQVKLAQGELNDQVRSLTVPGYEIDLNQPSGYRKVETPGGGGM
jgi:hypothetical protein